MHLRDAAVNVCVRLITQDRPDLVVSQDSGGEELLSKPMLDAFTRKFKSPKWTRTHQYGVAHLVAARALKTLLRRGQERKRIAAEARASVLRASKDALASG